MKKALKVTFGTLLAVSMAAPIAASAHDVWYNNIAVWGDVTYMKPTNNGLSVGDYALPPAPAAFDGARNHFFLEPENELDWGFGVSARVWGAHTRLFMSYDHFQADHDRQGDINIRNLGVVAPSTYNTSEYDLNAHEFRVGAVHDLHFGDHFCLDVLAFIEYDRVRQNFTEVINRNNNQDIRARETENLVKGLGPGIGFMSRWYASNPHWHVFAGVNTVLVKTENEYFQTFTVLADNGSPANVGNGYDYQPFDTDSIVGKLDIKFGINYHCAFRREMQGAKWDVALGMRYMNMFNVFKNGNTAYQVFGDQNARPIPDMPPYLGAAQDWGKWGPFLRFQIGGNAS